MWCVCGRRRALGGASRSARPPAPPGAAAASQRGWSLRRCSSCGMVQDGGNAVDGLMMDYPLTLQHMLWRVERLFDKKEIVTKREDGLHRYSYTDLSRRVARL